MASYEKNRKHLQHFAKPSTKCNRTGRALCSHILLSNDIADAVPSPKSISKFFKNPIYTSQRPNASPETATITVTIICTCQIAKCCIVPNPFPRFVRTRIVRGHKIRALCFLSLFKIRQKVYDDKDVLFVI